MTPILSPLELSHRESIRDLLTHYCYLHTARDFAGLAGLFTEDACFESLAGPCIGRRAIEGYFAKLLPTRPAGPDRKHFVSEVLIQLQGDAASVRSQFLMVRQAGKTVEVSAAGRYEDEVVLQEGAWRFRARRVLVDHRGDMGLHDS